MRLSTLLPRTFRRLGPVLFSGVALIAAAFSTTASDTVGPGEWPSLEELGFSAPTASQAQERITVYGNGSPVVFGPEDSIEEVASSDEDDGEQVISLSTDILFAPDSWDLPDTIDTKLEDVLADVPDDAELAVEGHTDSVQGEVDNQELSSNRAETVADVIAEVRPDLELHVEGYADTKPAEQEEGSDDDEARKANRRVELRFE